MHARSRTVTDLIQEANTDASALQGELEGAEAAHREAMERLEAARSFHENLDELLAVAENARLVTAAAARAHEASHDTCVAAESAEEALACKRDDVERVRAQRRLQEPSEAALCGDKSVAGPPFPL